MEAFFKLRGFEFGENTKKIIINI